MAAVLPVGPLGVGLGVKATELRFTQDFGILGEEPGLRERAEITG